MAEWKQIVPKGGNTGIGCIEKGLHEQYVMTRLSSSLSFNVVNSPSEVFVSDQTSNLFAIDMRNGRVIYGYKGNSPFRL